MTHGELLLGVDGGGTQCRARLARRSGEVLGEGRAGPANLRLGIEESIAAALDAAMQCFDAAGLSTQDFARTVACLALAGASEPGLLSRARMQPLPFRRSLATTDAHAACVGAHGGRDGGVVIVGTGTIGYGIVAGRHYRIGGWGWPISDEGSGAWLGCEAVRRALWAHDGHIGWTGLLRRVFEEFRRDPHEIVRCAATARPADYGALAPLVVEHAVAEDAVAVELMRAAAAHVDALAARLAAFRVPAFSFVGGLAPHIEPWLPARTRRRAVLPDGDALAGALRLAAREAE
ncbi:MAG TPA: BadF/BadG/BcrA/BcrD ATPase family protein [Stellaceae bacterium]|nr:BadF/BadG/BcrA/BcrD ATPase family protein [Stellaceae bacterium]